jgi:hypothetical protein
MSNSNNIYNILGKLAALAPKQETSAEAAKKIYESVEAQGSILSGVDAVQAKLAKAFAESIEEKAPPGAKAERMVKGIKKSLSKDGHLSDKDKAIAYATTWKAHNKGQVEEGQCSKCNCNPCECPTNESTCNECGMYESKCGCEHTNEDMSRAAKGHEKYGKKGMQALAKAGREGASEEELDTIRDKHNQYNEAEITRTAGKTVHRKTDFPGYPADDSDDIEDENKGKRGRPRKHAIKATKTDSEGNKLGRGRPKKDQPLGHNAPKMHDPFGRSRMPTKMSSLTQKGKVHTMGEAMSKLEQRFQQISEGVNFAELLKEKHQTVDEMIAQLSDDIKLFKETGNCSELLRDCMEIKGYHGKMVADESAHGGIPGNLPPAQVPGKTELLNPSKPGVMGAVKDVAKGLKDFVAGKPETGPTYEEVTMEDELNELARLAGLSTEGNAFTGKLASTPRGEKFELDGKEFTDTSKSLEEEPNEGNEFSGKLAAARAQGDTEFEVDGKEYPVKEADVTVEEPAEDELKNSPNPKYGTIKQITTQGDDMNRQKRQDPHTANKAANPFTNDVLALESQLAAEYESIKKVSK